MAIRTFTRPSSVEKRLASILPAEPMAPQDSPGKPAASESASKSRGVTYAFQDQLPKLPVPDLESTCQKYLTSLHPLQSLKEHSDSKVCVKEFLKYDGPRLQDQLKKYAEGRANYIEQFCISSPARPAMPSTVTLTVPRVRFLS